MKKIIVIIVMLSCVVGSVFINLSYNDNQQPAKFGVPEFADVRWWRAGEGDTEYIGFRSDGSYYYYCACGNPVDDSDLCETYIYDEKNKVIKLKCDAIYNFPAIKNIKVISSNSEKLVLDFGDDIREFEVESDERY